MSHPISSLEIPTDNWDFRDANTKEGPHVIHSYPAMMIPQVTRRLIQHLHQLQPHAHTLLDPFCGAGTVLVESARQGLKAWGNDLNPLALRIAKVRTTPIPESILTVQLRGLQAMLTVERLTAWTGPIPEFADRDFWFKPDVSHALAFVAYHIRTIITHPDVQDLAWITFSETVRLVSNTRHSEFKLYRLAPNKLALWNPKVLSVFQQTLIRYADGLRAVSNPAQETGLVPRIVFGDTRVLAHVPDQYFDLMVTSPPYGDSRTTVAYGQFSRLSLEWLGLPPEEARTVDRSLLGGHTQKNSIPSGDSPTLCEVRAQIAR